jgi:prepilin-type N-terminal cleavage/methylation domain-containing protein
MYLLCKCIICFNLRKNIYNFYSLYLIYFMNKKAFTLVELIVVMSVLVILSSLWYMSYMSYVTDTKDTNRVTQVHTIWDGIDLALSKWIWINPENSIQINVLWQKYSVQWSAWRDVIWKIKYFSSWLDPRDNKPFTFALWVNGREYDIYTILDNVENLPKRATNGIVNYTIDDKVPYVYGKNTIWILVDSDFVPLNLTTSWIINLDCSTDLWYKLLFSNWKILSPITSQSLYKTWPCYSDPGKTCKPQPSIVNATFNVWSPSESNQDWIKWDTTQACSYQCTNWYTWIFCEKQPAKTEITLMANEAFRNIIVDKCLVPATEYASKFNETTWHYNWTINCANKNLRDDDLDLFLPLKSLSWDLILWDPFANPDRNLFSDTEWLANLRILNKLNIRYTGLTDISWISSINTINELDLSYNSISNLSPISTITSLKKLDIESSWLINVSSLSTLIDLESINISKNSITDIAPLSTLLKLNYANLWDNNIIEISSIAWATNLNELLISNTSIADISPISWFANLINLDISDSENVFDITTVSSLTKLSALNIVWAWITDLSPLNTFSTTASNFVFYVDNDEYDTKINSWAAICNLYYVSWPTPWTYQVIYNDMSWVTNPLKKWYICN